MGALALRTALLLTCLSVAFGFVEAGTSCKNSGECPKREVCRLGSCTCPVLFRGPGCRTPQPAVARGCLHAFANWPSKGYTPAGVDFGHCAVVGSSSIMKGSKHGREIDKATAVFRFNEAPVKGHEDDVGKWRLSTIRLQNKVTRMSPSLEEYAGKYFRRYAQGEKRIGPQMAKMSNGFLGVVMALHLCGKVDVYGFDQGTGYYFKKFVGRPKGWGSNKVIHPSSRPFAERHSWTAERQCMKLLGSRLQEVTIYTKSGKISGGSPHKSVATRADAAARRAAVAAGAGSRPLWHSKRWRQQMSNATRQDGTTPRAPVEGAVMGDHGSTLLHPTETPAARVDSPERRADGGEVRAGIDTRDMAWFLRSLALSR